MALEQTSVLISDLKMIRSSLAAALQFHQATDIANAQMNMMEPRYRPLTRNLEGTLERVNGILGDWLIASHLEEPETTTEAQEPDEELDPNPLGSERMYERRVKQEAPPGVKHLGLYDGLDPDLVEAETQEEANDGD